MEDNLDINTPKLEFENKHPNNDWYGGIALIVGVIAFIGLWIYAISEWGLLIGLAIGWLPAIIGAVIIAFLWPVIALIIGYILLQGR